jgi:hypothetical protein
MVHHFLEVGDGDTAGALFLQLAVAGDAPDPCIDLSGSCCDLWSATVHLLHPVLQASSELSAPVRFWLPVPWDNN